MKAIKRIFIIIGLLIALLLVAAAALVGYLSITEYSPDSIEALSVSGKPDGSLSSKDAISVVSWNIGYCGLGENEDFFMDGGSGVRADSRETVETYLSGVTETLAQLDADAIMLQEVDTDSQRSAKVDEVSALAMGSYAYALNYRCAYVPFPLPPLGRVSSGLLSFSSNTIESAQRISLPCPFSWPLRAANLKRCMMPVYMPIEDSDKYLVLVNVHLEAYDNGEGRAAQTLALVEFMQSEYDKGNYVIVGGDFNQSFPGSLDVYENTHGELWSPGQLDEAVLPEGWSYAFDTSSPSCRLLNQPYDPADAENTQLYVIDGYILSPNVELQTVETLDMSFDNSDHNPVLLSVKLK